MKKVSEEKSHSEIGASSAERWVNCSASVMHIRDIPPEPESSYALEGTKAHELLEKWLLHIKKSKFAFACKGYDEEMIEHTQFAVGRVQAELKANKYLNLEVEQKYYLEHIHPEMSGTADIELYEHFGRLKIADFKYGKGVRVKASYEKTIGETKLRYLNLQTMFYLIGAAKKHDYNLDHAEIEIIQPRIGVKPETKFSNAAVSMAEIRAYEIFFKRAVDRVFSPKARYEAGPHCKWCRGKPTCKAYKKVESDAAFRSAVKDFGG